MKKLLCTILVTSLLTSSVPVYAADWEWKAITDTYTAKVGTTDFKKNGMEQPLDVEIYIKDGYVMLPLRTFLTAVDTNAKMRWNSESKIAEVTMHDGKHFTFDIKNNLIQKWNVPLKVSGKMEISGDRVFVPLRNWGSILSECGYTVTENDIVWDTKNRIASIYAKKTMIESTEEKINISGIGQPAEYSMNMTTTYDRLTNLGNGYFLAEKCSKNPTSFEIFYGGNDVVRYLLDAEGNVLKKYATGTDSKMVDGGENTFIIRRISNVDEMYGIVDYNGDTIVPFEYTAILPYTEGLARVEKEDKKWGYVDRNGEIVIPLQFGSAENFSEGIAAVYDRKSRLWGYINETGEMIVDYKYDEVQPFSEGLAAVKTTDHKYGFIDKTGKEVISPQYEWVGEFHDGTTFIRDKNSEIWLIDRNGKKLKFITEDAEKSGYSREPETGIVMKHVSATNEDGIGRYTYLYYDKNGLISEEENILQEGLSEGVSAYRDNSIGKYRYVDENGKILISDVYDYAEKFKAGYAIVVKQVMLPDGTQDVEWGIIKHPRV